MALTPFRWVALAAIGCMLAIVAVVSYATAPALFLFLRPPQYTPVDTEEARLAAVAASLNQTSQIVAARYRVLYLADSVRRVASRMPDTGAMRVFVSSEYDPATRSLIDRAIRDARSARQGNAGRIDLSVVIDTAQMIRGVPRYPYGVDVRYDLPAKAGDRCQVFVRSGNPASVAKAFSSEKATEQLLGPCAYFLAFGDPGPFIRQWMLGTGWQYAIEGSWTRASPVMGPARDDDSRIFKGPSPALNVLNTDLGGPDCIKGELDTCERAVTIGPPVRRFRGWGGSMYSVSLGNRRYYTGALGYQAGEFLADAVRGVGRERFRSFWTSADSVPVAFQKATGERWGAFIRSWMIAQYGEIHAGPRVSAYAAVAGTLLVIVAIGATMLMSVRRTYV